jgi:hypothetical protein
MMVGKRDGARKGSARRGANQHWHGGGQARNDLAVYSLRLSSLKRTIGDLDLVVAWARVFGMVNSAPGFNSQPGVINGFSDLILELYGADRGMHARSAVGMAELPFDMPVEVEAEIEIA